LNIDIYFQPARIIFNIANKAIIIPNVHYTPNDEH